MYNNSDFFLAKPFEHPGQRDAHDFAGVWTIHFHDVFE
jgi:hypothetical protein